MYDISKSFPLGGDLEEAAIWYNDGSTSLTTGAVIYPDKVRLNLYHLHHYSFWKDIEMIFATVLGPEDDVCGGEDMRCEAYEI